MGRAWYFVVNDERVEIHVRSSCGSFALSTLPQDWRQQFLMPDVREAILAELLARQTLQWPNRRKATDEATTGDTVPMSWYSVRARLLPATLEPVAHMDLALDGRDFACETQMSSEVVAAGVAIQA
jgi:hypothetical protein